MTYTSFPDPAVAVFAAGSDHDGAAVDGHGVAEPVALCGVVGRQRGQLFAITRSEDVDRAAGASAEGPGYDGIAIDRHGDAERRAVARV